MLISIVIPTYNRSGSLKKNLPVLRECLGESADVEVFVVDDCSHDGHKPANTTLCEKLGFHYRWLAQNRGPAHARNVGISHATGEWVAFLDDDVRVDTQWLLCLRNALSQAPHETLGIEGAVKSLGSGLWDTEVENLAGGLYLSCNCVYRRKTLVQTGGFDEEFCGPFAEDHELACRIKKRGDIVFEKKLVVFHRRRNIRLVEYCRNSLRRMRMMLDAELYFYLKHRDRYHTFRYAPTFWHGLVLILFKHAISTIRRRTIGQLLLNPVQAAALLVSSILEQVSAWLLAPRYLAAAYGRKALYAEQQTDWEKTSALWGFTERVVPSVLRFDPDIIGSILFRLQKKPVYDARAVFKKTVSGTRAAHARIFIRIDDLFLRDQALVERFCDLLKGNAIPFLAAITGNDLLRDENLPAIRTVIRCGGAIGVHGFSHSGRFGPYQSEILQLSFPQLDRLNGPVLDACTQGNVTPVAFVPPFNAVSWDQICHLGTTYPVICGGPETMRFTGRLFGPVVLNSGSLFFPSCQPFYGSAASLVTPAMYKAVMGARAPVCCTFHFHQEAEDGFSSLLQCFQLYGGAIHGWQTIRPKDTIAAKDG